MKYLIVSVLLIITLCGGSCCDKGHKKQKSVKRIEFLNKRLKGELDFIIGLIEGLGIKEDVDVIKKCIKNISPLLKKIREALYLLIHLNIKDIQKGIIQLILAVGEILMIIKPCVKETKVIIKLITMLQNINPLQIIIRISQNMGKFINIINSAIRGFVSGNMYVAGKAIGELLRLIFLDPMVVNKK